MSLVGLVVDVHDALVAADLDHAFGGALALAYVADPRGTIDVDVVALRGAGMYPRVARLRSLVREASRDAGSRSTE